MNDFETELHALRREGPSPELDGRMTAAFALAKQGAARRPVVQWLWWCGGGMGVAAAAAVALVLTRPVAPSDRIAAIYRVDAPPSMRALLLEPGQVRHEPPRVVVRVSTP